ncbi:MAG TPA: response regulator [Oscillatoriales cyanobacterium M59_W2019_021]|nr:MAG: response regulator [Cyanobacteria bacterium J055]HIK33758.1 response regulator [Oscillatoriales cyanobacterium M4454_W2019_049]HIK53111.1 response regulator [Oscillatoriales cyanobacterium M59_W2019_021]
MNKRVSQWWNRRLGKYRLRTVLVVPFLLQISTAVGLTGWLAIRNGQRAVSDAIVQLSSSVTDRIDRQVQNYLDTPHLFHQINASAIRNGNLNPENFAALRSTFWSQIQLNEAVDYIFFGNEEGGFLGVQKLPDGEIVLKTRNSMTAPNRVIYPLDNRGQPLPAIESKPYDPRDRPWYLAAKERGEPTWSPIYPSAHLGSLQITPVVPIYNQAGKLRGVLGTNLILSEISKFLEELKISPNGEAFIIERSGELVASSTKETYILKTENGERRVSAVESQDPAIAQTTQQLIDRFGDLQQIASTRQFADQFNGDRQFVQVTPLQDDRGLDWLIIVTIPESDFMAQIDANTRTTILLCLVALFVAAIAGILTARWVVLPIGRLNAAAKAIAREEWETVEDRDRLLLDRDDEIGELARSFYRMAERLQQSFAALETKNEDLQRLDKLKDEFLANTSHELRTPLNATIGIVESMLDGATGELTEFQRKNLLMVAQSGHRLSNLVNDILDFAKLRNNTLELQLKPVSLREMVQVVMTFCSSLVGNKNLQLINAVSPNLPPVRADENRLQQIFYNLIGNSIKFTEFGMVGVCAELVETDSDSDERQIAIVVSDTGIGIAEDQIDRIFESFEQGDGSTARTYGGTGLGLAVTKKLVELHGGTISVKSIVGSGSQFTFTLPIDGTIQDESNAERTVPLLKLQPSNFTFNGLATLPGATLVETSKDESLDRPFEILIVDDEPVNLQVLINHLSPENYTITQASNGVEALELIDRGYQPDLILLDVMMPKMTGYEVCQKLREKFSSNELPIVMLTAKNQTSDVVVGLNSGANDYLTKPVKKTELIARLKNHLKLSSVYTAYDRFVPHQFLQFLNKESILEVKLGDEVQKTMSVLFSDIRDFTTLSENMTPEENFKFINSYLSQMEPAILENNGFIDKYIGDAIMALFGAEADDAVNAGISMLQRLETYNKHRRKIGYVPIHIGIGINTGELMLGTVGGQKRMDSTVISDAVNVASRIEGLTKNYGASLLISDRTFAALQAPENYCLRLLDQVKVKGKSEMISVFEVFDADPEELRNGKSETKTFFEQAVALYTLGHFVEATSLFDECLRLNPGDAVASLYLEKCRRHLG